MSVYIVGLALAAGYLVNKNINTRVLDNAEAEYNDATASSGGATTAELRAAWKNTSDTRFLDMAEDVSETRKLAMDAGVAKERRAVEAYEASSLPQIQGVVLSFDRSCC